MRHNWISDHWPARKATANDDFPKIWYTWSTAEYRVDLNHNRLLKMPKDRA